MEVTDEIEHDLTDALARAIARRCRGHTAVLGGERLAEALTAHGVEAVVGVGGGSPETIVCFETVERLERAEAERQLDAVWSELGDDGVLIVVARNADAAARGEAGLHRRKLKSLMERFGKTRTLRSQPFRWVGTVNVKGTTVNPDNARRLEATARECRGHVLELGSGRGHLSAAIALGIDLNARKVAEARTSYPEIEFRQGDILEIGPELGQFDTVVIAEVLEHVPEEIGREMVRICWQHVAPGGRLVASTPNEDMVPHQNHVTIFTARSFRELLAAHGEPRFCEHQPLRWLLAVVEKPL